ncbi:MAG: HIT domain-containing protein [Clostridiales bacterium]|jgi:histidine triad (HIT) family protein|nr:HIT domain-containing protein [Clostridiales bacterium]
MKSECMFCKLVNDEIPSYRLFEDDDILVILDKFPRNMGECLILTKEHYDNLFDLDSKLVGKLFRASIETAEKLRRALPIDGLNILQNNGEAAGQQINHFHIHVIPRYDFDSIIIQGKALNPSEEEFEAFAAKYAAASD